MSTTLANLYAKLKTGEVPMYSKYGAQNEAMTTMGGVTSIPFLNRERVLKYKLLIPLRIAIPFDPRKGVVTEEFNPSREMIIPASVHDSIKVLKYMAQEHPTMVEVMCEKSGVPEWDVSNPEEVNKTDLRVFKPFIVLRRFTSIVTTISDPLITGSKGVKHYLLDSDSIKKDEFGVVQSPYPYWYQAHRFISSVVYSEIRAIEQARILAKAGKPFKDIFTPSTEKASTWIDKLHTLNDDDWKSTKSEIYSKGTISRDQPQSSLIVYAIKLTTKGALSKDTYPDGFTLADAKNCLRITTIPKALNEQLTKYRNEEYEQYDVYTDFFEIDMSGPPEATTDKRVGVETTYSYPAVPLHTTEYHESVVNAIREDITNTSDEIEKRYKGTTRYEKMNSEIEDRIRDTFAETFDLDDRWVTNNLLKSSADFVRYTFGAKGEDKLMEIEMENDSDKLEGSEDTSEQQKEKDTLDLTALARAAGDIDSTDTIVAVNPDGTYVVKESTEPAEDLEELDEL